jgi:hypothetical protein
MKGSRADLALILLMLVIVGAMAWETQAMGGVARRVPAPVLWMTLALLLLQAMSELIPAVGRATRAYTARVALREPAPPDREEPAPPPAEEDRGVAGIVWAAALPAAAAVIGLLPASFLYLLLYLRLRGGLAWGPSLVAAAGLVGGVYLMLERLFGMTVYRGLFF